MSCEARVSTLSYCDCLAHLLVSGEEDKLTGSDVKDEVLRGGDDGWQVEGIAKLGQLCHEGLHYSASLIAGIVLLYQHLPVHTNINHLSCCVRAEDMYPSLVSKNTLWIMCARPSARGAAQRGRGAE